VTGRTLQEPEQAAAHAELRVIETIRLGDEAAFARLVDQYHARLRGVARIYVSNRAVADEVVQDTWLGMIQGMWAFEGRSSLKAWIFRIIRAKTRAVREGRTVSFAGFGADDVGAPENQRLVSTLRDIEGCSTEEVCNAPGIQETNGRVLLHRARAKVRAALEPCLEGG
jgi:RNA polymerase sigma-70 factor (ECF subfamily)